ncbi:hypothetical protein L6R49_17260 [Myxococcota bacterium]|nr:hypothetical protein [Myxococcota bacterium]
MSRLISSLSFALTIALSGGGVAFAETHLAEQALAGPTVQLWVDEDSATVLIDGVVSFEVPLRHGEALDPMAMERRYDDALLLGGTLMVRRGVAEGPGVVSPAESVELYDLSGRALPAPEPALLALLSGVDEQLIAPDGAWSVAIVSGGRAGGWVQGLVVVTAEGALVPVRLDAPAPYWPEEAHFVGDQLVLPLSDGQVLAVNSAGQRVTQVAALR